MRKRLLAGLALASAFACGVVIAQPVITQSLDGDETVLFSLGPGGTSGFTNVYNLRGRGLSTIAAGTTVNTSAVAASNILAATGAITTWNVSLPMTAQAWNGQVVNVNCPGGTTTTLAISVSTPYAIVGSTPTTCTAALSPQGSGYVFQSSNRTWYRYQ